MKLKKAFGFGQTRKEVGLEKKKENKTISNSTNKFHIDLA